MRVINPLNTQINNHSELPASVQSPLGGAIRGIQISSQIPEINSSQSPTLIRKPWVESQKIRQSLLMNISSHELTTLKELQPNNISKLSEKARWVFYHRAAITLEDSGNIEKKEKIHALLYALTRFNLEEMNELCVFKKDINSLSGIKNSDLKALLQWDFPKFYQQIDKNLMELKGPPSYSEAVSSPSLPDYQASQVLHKDLPSYEDVLLQDKKGLTDKDKNK